VSRPLWQIFLVLFLVSFVIHRGAATFVVYTGEIGAALFAAYAFQTLAGALAALGVWLGRSWVLGVVLVLGTAVAGTSLLEAFFLGVRPAAGAVTEVLVAAVATGALFLVLRHELGPRGTAETLP